MRKTLKLNKQTIRVLGDLTSIAGGAIDDGRGPTHRASVCAQFTCIGTCMISDCGPCTDTQR